ncbi:hybrid sensor histidine kinase/response regulator [Phyllobacterium sp. YR531]|uniref:ATP-binding response regulator n=1 Tax=Phyllobacterium sp. YR531 TaxID=1144343 RepID=UPI0012F6F7EC|nr:hybrid sensor histidine kinase/response regulator [Phyllobacterium sp. YR531]
MTERTVSLSWVNSKLSQIFISTRENRKGAEYSQALFRVVAGPVFVICMSAIMATTGNFEISPSQIALYSSIYSILSISILIWVIQRPGEYLSRRVFAMVMDYSAITSIMSIGDSVLLPTYAPLLWVTLGYGLRFGSQYLVISTCMALVSILTATYFNSFLWNYPYVVVAFILTTIAVPTYAHRLVSRTFEAHSQAVQANQTKSRFLAQASHDLRQPIHAISLFTACLRDTGLSSEQHQMVDNIDRSVHSVSGLFRSLLDISTLESGKVQPRLQPVAIGVIIDDLIQQNREAAKWAGVVFRQVPANIYVSTDATLIATVLQNILSNAIKYAPGRQVLVGCRRRRGCISIEVHDQGEGIAAHHLPMLFEEFYQARERGDKDVEGVGLGLAIVKRLVKLLEIEVSIRSLRGRGTSVIIDGLKIAHLVAQADVVQISERKDHSAMKGLRVLLVEDDKNVLLATATLLEKWGCTVQADTGLPKNVAVCDLIITDFDLGANLTGTDCISRVRQLLGRDIPAVIMTGHDVGRILEEPGNENIPVLSKPVRSQELREVVLMQKVKIDELARTDNKERTSAQPDHL